MSGKIELLGARTGNCFRAAIALEEAGVPYKVRHVDLIRGEQKSPKYLLLNPAGVVPTLVEEPDLVLTQSNAIVFYAAGKRPDTIIPAAGTIAHIRAVERFFYLLTDVISISFAAFQLRGFGLDRSSDVLSERALDALVSTERFLGLHRYMAGDTFTIADIAAVTIVRAFSSALPWADSPLLKGWFEDVSERPSVLAGFHAFDR